jgi:hypothetical protein
MFTLAPKDQAQPGIGLDLAFLAPARWDPERFAVAYDMPVPERLTSCECVVDLGVRDRAALALQ